VEEFDPQQIANTLHAFAKLDLKNDALLIVFGDRIAKDPKFLKQFEDVDVSLTLHSYAKVGIFRQELADLLVEEILDRPDFFRGEDHVDRAQSINQVSLAVATFNIKHTDMDKMLRKRNGGRR
jgi:hypothetical protein